MPNTTCCAVLNAVTTICTAAGSVRPRSSVAVKLAVPAVVGTKVVEPLRLPAGISTVVGLNDPETPLTAGVMVTSAMASLSNVYATEAAAPSGIIDTGSVTWV